MSDEMTVAKAARILFDSRAFPSMMVWGGWELLILQDLLALGWTFTVYGPWALLNDESALFNGQNVRVEVYTSLHVVSEKEKALHREYGKEVFDFQASILNCFVGEAESVADALLLAVAKAWIATHPGSAGDLL